MALFLLNLRTVVISMTFQKLEPRAIYLPDTDSCDSKAFSENRICKLRRRLDGSFASYHLQSNYPVLDFLVH